MILLTVPGIVTLGRSGIRSGSKSNSAILADLAICGFAISLLTLASLALWDCFFVLLRGMQYRGLKIRAVLSHSAQLQKIRPNRAAEVAFASVRLLAELITKGVGLAR